MDSNAGRIIVAEVSEIVSQHPYKILAYAASESCDGEELEVSYLGKPNLEAGKKVLAILECIGERNKVSRAGYVSSAVPNDFDYADSEEAVLVATWEDRMGKNLAPTLSAFRQYFGIKDLSRMLYYEQYHDLVVPVCVLEGKQPAIIRRFVDHNGIILLKKYLELMTTADEKNNSEDEYVGIPELQSIAGAFRVYDIGNRKCRSNGNGRGNHICCPNVISIYGNSHLENYILSEIGREIERKGKILIHMEPQR